MTGLSAHGGREIGPVVAARLRQKLAARTARIAPATRAAQAGFLAWAEAGRFMADDRDPLDLAGAWRYLRPLYDAVPARPDGLDLVVQKPAQGGASIFALLLALWLCLRGTVRGAYFLPVQDMAWEFSQDRFIRMVRQNPALHALLGDPDSGHSRRVIDEGSAGVRRLLRSILYFTYVGGKISTESRPLDFLIFDEVQEMLLADMQKAEERIASSPLKLIVRVSTANFAGADINHYYERSDQREFHTRCACPGGVVLADQWDPQLGALCIREPRDGGAPHYWCPQCDTRIDDPRAGRFVPHNPGGERIGFHWAQMLSPRITAGELLKKWRNRTDTKSFYNRVLGKPYADPTTLPVTQEALEGAQDPALRWGVPTTTIDQTFLGIDQMGQVNYCVLKGRVRDTGKMRLLHLEVVHGDDPWRRCAALMREYRVTVCAVESLPNYNEAFRFAKAFPGRVFVVEYQDLAEELILWGDRPRDKVTVRKTDHEARLRFTAKVDQFKMMSWALGKWSRGEVETPDARTLMQRLRTPEGEVLTAICRDVFWLHLQRVALVTEYRQGKEDERRLRRSVKKIGIDPHFAYANMLCDVAWVRAYGTEQMLLQDDELPETPAPAAVGATRLRVVYRQQVAAAMPDTFGGEVAADPHPEVREAPPTCGTCIAFSRATGLCVTRRFYVAAGMPGCDAYEAELEEEGYP